MQKRARLILIARYEGDATLQEIATELGVTKERVRQLEAKILRKLRHPSRRGLFPLLPEKLQLAVAGTEETRQKLLTAAS